MKRYGRPEVVVTDRLRSYRAAMKIIGIAERQETGRYFNPVDQWTAPTRWSDAIKETADNTDCNILPDHEFGHLSCTDARAFVREIFLDSLPRCCTP